MRLAVVDHKICWPSSRSPSGYATDGGFPLHVRLLSELFDATRVLVPCVHPGDRQGEIPLVGKNLVVVPLANPRTSLLWRRMALPFWIVRNGPRLVNETWRSDAVFALILGDIGVLGMFTAWALRKPLLVRHKNSWLEPRTMVERIERVFLERVAGGRNVVLATGESDDPPSRRNPSIRWIFSTTLTEQELARHGLARDLRPAGDFRLISVARQEPSKGTDVLIRSLPLLRAALPGVSLDVVGDGSQLPHLRRLAQQLGVQDQVRFHGLVNHEGVLGALREADLYCLPTTESEGFTKTVLEALACGLPVVTTAVPVLQRLIGDRCGVVVKDRTPEAFADAIGACLRDAARYKRMSLEAVRTARPYSLERWRDTVGGLLESAWGPLSQQAP